ncbi:MAG TPA: MmgE/PrpD family protein [Vicinamibacterales bacterium]|nr:MmgE/PrpD family protein [Vicinamibacterales bacterium]
MDQCRIWAGDHRASPPHAALINGTSAHALDYDDMCFVSLAHPSAPLVPAIVAAGELAGASGRAVLDAYVVGFEVQARLGQLMNPRHYQRGWHCTSTLGAMSAAAGAARVLGLDAATTAHALAIAASSASGLKENFGTMVKPLHAGLAARDGITAALLARSGLTGSDKALDGPQGFLRAFDSERVDLRAAVSDLGSRWEILETGVTVKLYPSCAGTHPTLDALLDLRAEHSFEADSVAAVEIEVDPIVPTILLYDRPATALEGKFSMPFCAAAAIVFGRVGIDTFDDACLRDSRVVAVMSRITMRVDEAIGAGRPALTESRVRVRLTDGRVLTKDAHGARGYPSNPASQAELDAKFLACAGGVVGAESASALLTRLKQLDDGPLVL